MKICFSGSHRTGKTTLAERVALDNDLAMHYTRVSDTFGKKTTSGIENLSGKDGFYEGVLQQELILKHISDVIEQGGEFSVFDRCALDVFAYSEFFLGRILSSFRAEPNEFRAFGTHLMKVKDYFNQVDFIFIVQPGIEFKPKVGSGSLETQELLNEVFLNAASCYLNPSKYFVIPSKVTNFEERVEICQNILKQIRDFKDIYGYYAYNNEYS